MRRPALANLLEIYPGLRCVTSARMSAYTGAWVAMKRGTAFIRGLFLCLLIILILKLAYDMVKPA